MRKKHFLIVLSLLFIFSCTREYSTEANNRIEDNTNAWVGKVNFQEMENFIQKNTKKQIPNYLKLHNLGKRTEQYITDIDTTDIIKVVHDSITSFTIKVNTLSDKDFTFSNLVINVKNNKIEEYIYHYKPEAQWLRAYIAGEENNYEGVLKITDIDGNDTRKTYSRQASTPTTCMVYIHVPCYGSGCPCTDYNGVTYYMAATCGGGGGDGNSGDYPSGELSGGGGGGGTVPSVPTSEQINSFIAFLSPSIHAYITQNTNTLTDINNYFIQNGLSPKHQSFITSILEYVERKDIAWFTFSSTFNSAVAYKKQYPDNWIKISTIQDFAFDFMLQNPNTSWEQFQNWFIEGDQDFNRDLLKMIVENNHKIPQYTSSDFPGMNNGMPYNWWNDENYLNNMSLGFNNINLTKEEKKMCALFPLAAVMIFSNKDIALNEASSTFPNQIPHNNKADAFRHAFFNALNIRDVYSQFSTRGTFTFAKNIVRMFGIAHESEVPQELLLEKAMDLYNNERGIEVCSTCNPLTNPTNLVKGYVLSLLNEGKLVHIWPLNNDQTIRPDSNIYPTNQH